MCEKLGDETLNAKQQGRERRQTAVKCENFTNYINRFVIVKEPAVNGRVFDECRALARHFTGAASVITIGND
jgi:hypothetical protein